jgi:hypothetical protein
LVFVWQQASRLIKLLGTFRGAPRLHRRQRATLLAQAIVSIRQQRQTKPAFLETRHSAHRLEFGVAIDGIKPHRAESGDFVLI